VVNYLDWLVVAGMCTSEQSIDVSPKLLFFRNVALANRLLAARAISAGGLHPANLDAVDVVMLRI
jgi:hypothetical protein